MKLLLGENHSDGASVPLSFISVLNKTQRESIINVFVNSKVVGAAGMHSRVCGLT
jgi:hypothetical protein